jgi:cephalosporin-C deacetylase-like acetyl esterase
MITRSERGLACLVYDHPCVGASDGEPRQEVDPVRHVRGYRDAITFAGSLAGIDPERIAVWGTSMAGAYVFTVAALDGHRVKAAVSQVPAVAGLPTFQRLVPAYLWPDLLGMIDADREARFAGEEPLRIPVDLCFEYTPEAFLDRVAPTPIMMTIADQDNLCVTELQLAAYQQLREPKQLQILRGNHYVAYEHGQPEAAAAQAEFLLRHLA